MIESTSHISFLSGAEKLTLAAFHAPREESIVASEIVSRLAAVILLSSAAALDIAFHSLMVIPTTLYATGKSIYQRQADFTLPWQHIQRIRNAVAPLFLGSFFGFIHPFAGLAVCEPTDKHIVIGMLSSNTGLTCETPCSPIHSLAITEEMAIEGRKKGVFSAEQIKVLRDARSFEESLESLQAQEYIHKITNVTLFAMANILEEIKRSRLSETGKEVLARLSGVLVPVLTAVDIVIAAIVQVLFLTTGIARLISGRGPIYTEVTTNPLMHVSFLIQSILKSVGNLIGTLVWLASPELGFKVSLVPAHLFFKMQMAILMLQIRIKMHFADEGSRFVVPIVFGNGESTAFQVPTHSMHKTYLIVEKKNEHFNLYWVNRPSVSLKQGLEAAAAREQIRSMLDERFPFMDMEKMMNYPVKMNQPGFSDSESYSSLEGQGNNTNCVVSNLFGMLEAMDRIAGTDPEVTKARYTFAREYLTKQYGFYKDGFFPFSNLSEWFSLNQTWKKMAKHPHAAI